MIYAVTLTLTKTQTTSNPIWKEVSDWEEESDIKNGFLRRINRLARINRKIMNDLSQSMSVTSEKIIHKKKKLRALVERN